MTPVKQTKFGAPGEPGGPGNCFQACVATILDLPLEMVPEFGANDTSNENSQLVREAIEWIQAQGWSVLTINWDSEGWLGTSFSSWGEKVHCIIGGESPRSTEDRKLYHAIVGRLVGGVYERVHDPHPDNTFLKKATSPTFAMWIFKIPTSRETTFTFSPNAEISRITIKGNGTFEILPNETYERILSDALGEETLLNQHTRARAGIQAMRGSEDIPTKWEVVEEALIADNAAMLDLIRRDLITARSNEGWELVNVMPGYEPNRCTVFFKRPVKTILAKHTPSGMSA